MNILERDRSSQLLCFSLIRSTLMLLWFSHCWWQRLLLRNQMLLFKKRKMTKLGTAARGIISVQNCLLPSCITSVSTSVEIAEWRVQHIDHSDSYFYNPHTGQKLYPNCLHMISKVGSNNSANHYYLQ